MTTRTLLTIQFSTAESSAALELAACLELATKGYPGKDYDFSLTKSRLLELLDTKATFLNTFVNVEKVDR